MAEINKIKEKIRSGAERLFAWVDSLTRVQRLIICLLSFAAIGGGYYYFVFAPRAEMLASVEAELKSQEEKLNTFMIKARSLEKFEKKMAEVQEEFNTAMKALPDKKELPSLLVGVSKAGGNAGLEFLLFQPEPVVNKEFYKEIPLSMTVNGGYHQIADFFYQVARLNRIVNIKDMSMTIDMEKQGKVLMKCSAVTYMFSEEPEKDGKDAKGKKGKNTKQG